jgi:PD-(D/E)XK nuclease superfamily protein
MASLPPPGRLSPHPVEIGQRTEAAIICEFVRRGYRVLLTFGEIELFAVYCHELRRLYAVPVEVAAKTQGTLRVDPAVNNQSRRIVWAADFELPA